MLPLLFTPPLTLPLYPPSVFLFVMMLRIPPTPSASYFEEGLVITSMSLMVLAGRLLSTSLKFVDIIEELLPFTSTLKFDCPFTVMFSSASTVTRGTFLSISSALLVCASGSDSIL